MSKPVSRLLATSFRQTARAPVTTTSIRLPIRSFSQTCRRLADESGPNPPQSIKGTPSDPQSPEAPPTPAPGKSPLESAPSPRGSPSSPAASLRDLSSSLSSPRSGPQVAQDVFARARNQPTAQDILAGSGDEGPLDKENWAAYEEPFHFHIYGHKHNTHITVTKPDRNAILSVSAGQIGFRKTKRGSYDAAHQLTAYVIDKLNQGNWHRKIHKLEVVLRGFGNGREAATKVLLGNEGKFLRPKITVVSDSTRLKFGGTRSRKPRRLG
ncbi:hypothetical protein JX265_009081 [Neoarthrinium moseri]|uniref:Uncharacterized protein n=1 Tax=Neoarthrinium moseri TaxID=1658444 RepID=A0A9P9WH99_9PEZI|nr:uncharacterized protein JN550_011466 [Neoarthrinium moseri]KAI1846615.1 hypothetical protein JX266_007188 [Neoarthrinium moseri]KAI1860618.1 hypothetical protein JN550_011466 [Neoarthrinium moseri]KAI1863035.1 hypothetical protein JX265_009081 [Neoarthrinium moseri]